MSSKKERNIEITRKYDEGISIAGLSSEYGLSEETVKYVISTTKQRLKDLEVDSLLEDSFKIARDINRIRKIRVGDVVKVRHNSSDGRRFKYKSILAGPVIYLDEKLITVRGEFYAESFCLFDLVFLLVDHIPT